MTQMNQPKFLGFGSVEELVDVVPPERPIYATRLITTTGPAVGTQTHQVLLQAELGSNIAYVQIRAGSCAAVHGEVFPEELRERLDRRSAGLKALVIDWLKARGRTVIEATYARPKDYVFLDGVAGFATFDAETDSFRLKSS